MRKLYEIFRDLKIQKRIVFAENIRGNTVTEMSFNISLYYFGTLPVTVL